MSDVGKELRSNRGCKLVNLIFTYDVEFFLSGYDTCHVHSTMDFRNSVENDAVDAPFCKLQRHRLPGIVN